MKCISTLSAFIGLFSAMDSHMLRQITFIASCMLTLITFIGLFSSVCHHMSSHAVCPQSCEIALVAFEPFLLPEVGFLFDVGFHVQCQITFIAGCIFTFVASIRPFSSVNYHMSFQAAYPQSCEVALGAFEHFLFPKVSCTWIFPSTI